MPVQRQTIPVLFNQGIDAGGEDPRIKQGGLIKAENLIFDRGTLTCRDGLTQVGKGARGFFTSSSTVIIADQRSDIRTLSPSNTFTNSRFDTERAFAPTVWERVIATNTMTAADTVYCITTPIVYATNYRGGTNLFTYAVITNGATVNVNVSVVDADTNIVVNTTSQQCNSNAVGLLYDSQDRKIYLCTANAGVAAIRISAMNVDASTLTWDAVNTVTGLPRNLTNSYTASFGIARYEMARNTDPGVFVKRLIFAYSNNVANHCAVAVNLSTNALGAVTNETSSWVNAHTYPLATPTFRNCVAKDMGARMADTNWALSGNVKSALAAWQSWTNGTNGHVHILEQGSTSAKSFTYPYSSVPTNTAGGAGLVSIMIADCATTNTSAANMHCIADCVRSAQTNVARTAYVSGSFAYGYYANGIPDATGFYPTYNLAGRPFTIGNKDVGTLAIPSIEHGGMWYSSDDASNQTKATVQNHVVLFADGIPANNALDDPDPSQSAVILQGTGYRGSSGTNALPGVVSQHDILGFCGYSYGGSSGTNAYYITVLEQAGTEKRAVLFRAKEEDHSDGFFSGFTISKHRDGAVISGGAPKYIDGGRSRPTGWLTYPDGITASIIDNTSTNTFSGLGTIGLCATWELKDRYGFIYRSAPSPTISISLTNVSNRINTIVPYPSSFTRYGLVPNLSKEWSIVVYRTEPNGTQYFECARIDGSAASTAATGLAGVPITISGETLVQSSGESTYTYMPSLYTQTEAENIFPYGHKCGCIYQDRYVYAVGATDLYYSKPAQPGVAIEFNEFFNLRVPASGGEIIALRQMDDKLIIFKETEIYSTYGEGFGPNLGGSNYAPPRRIAAGTGCKQRNCVAVIPQGILFLSQSGIWLLGRDEQLSRVGGAVAYYTDQYAYTCAATNPAKRYAIFVSSATNAPALVYSYDSGGWTTFTGRYSGQKYIDCATNGMEIVGGGINSSATSATNAGDAFNPIYITSSSSNEAINVALETGWYSFAGPLGYNRWKKTVLFLQQTNTAYTLTKKTAYDADPYWLPDDTETFSPSSLALYDHTAHYGAMTNSALADQTYKLEFSGSRQKTDSLRHGFYLTNVNGGSISFVGMAFEVAQKPGTVRLGSAKKMT